MKAIWRRLQSGAGKVWASPVGRPIVVGLGGFGLGALLF